MEDFDNIDQVMLPGFRFHPTDEELVGFYLTKKIQQKPLSIELIKQLDIYKYDPWDLSKFATSGEKEWYFYCPRDRKYRNSVRPNRVTGAGFWKATGTDRPIYSSETSSKCIGLKKSLVFYKGRAAKGIKTDWMMHEFRLPTVSDSLSHKRLLDKNVPANEAWAICRIFKKAKSKQRAMSHSWESPIFDTTTQSNITNLQATNNIHFSSSNLTMEKTTTPLLQFGFYNDIPEQSSIANLNPPHLSPWKPLYHVENNPISNGNQLTTKCDASSLLLDMSTSILGSESVDFSILRDQCEGFSTILPENMEGNICHDEHVGQYEDQFGEMTCMGFGNAFPLSSPNDVWKSSLLWDSSPCISDLSTGFSTNKCYT